MVYDQFTGCIQRVKQLLQEQAPRGDVDLLNAFQAMGGHPSIRDLTNPMLSRAALREVCRGRT